MITAKRDVLAFVNAAKIVRRLAHLKIAHTISYQTSNPPRVIMAKQFEAGTIYSHKFYKSTFT